MDNEKRNTQRQEPVYSKRVKAGKKRTYFFDVKANRGNEYFLTITESKKRNDEGYERFKILVYREDFNRFLEALQETINHIKTELMPGFDFEASERYADSPEYDHTHNFHPESGNEDVVDKTDETEKDNSGNSTDSTQPDNTNENDNSGNISSGDDDLKW